VSKMIMDGSADEIVETGDLASAVDGPLIEEMVTRARAQGLELTGPNGLLGQLTKRVLESALEGEITDHLGYGSTNAIESVNARIRRAVRAHGQLPTSKPHSNACTWRS
jgi:transposase-like protein